MSYFEWVQNLTREQWPLEKVNRKLEAKMTKAFNDVVAIVEKEESDMRTGALMLGVGRVANAIKTLGTLAINKIRTEDSQNKGTVLPEQHRTSVFGFVFSSANA